MWTRLRYGNSRNSLLDLTVYHKINEMKKRSTDKLRGFPSKFLFLLTPLILLPDLLLLAGGEVVLDVERLPDLLWGLALDHVSHGLAGDVQETLQETWD